jgi:hypothetical protein
VASHNFVSFSFRHEQRLRSVSRPNSTQVTFRVRSVKLFLHVLAEVSNKSFKLISSYGELTLTPLVMPYLRWLVAGFPPRRPRAQVMSFGICGGQSGAGAGFFSEYFNFPCQFSFHRLFHTHHLSSGAGKIGHLVATYQVDSVSPNSKKLTISK